MRGRLSQMLTRIGALVTRRSRERRLDEELRFHLEMQAEENRRAGMTEEEARRDAALRFGGRERWREEARDEYRSRTLEDLGRDLRYAARTLRRSPAFTVTAVLTLAVGIGANTAIFSAVDGVLLKPLPFADASRVMTLWQRNAKRHVDRDNVAPGTFLDWRERTRSFAPLAAAEPYSVSLDTPDGPEMIRNWNVTEGFFEALGVRAYLGRTFEPADFLPGRERVVVFSYEGWRRRFGGDPSAIGRRLRLERMPATIVGVLPPNVSVPDGREMWAPKAFEDYERQERGSAYYQVIGRLAPGVSREQADEEMKRISAQLAAEYPRTNADIGVNVLPIEEFLVAPVRPALLLLLGAVGLVLLIACANVANLLLARTTRRGRELAIRAALGAGQWRVTRQLLAESLLLALVGGSVGALLARWCVAALRAISPAGLPRVGEMQVDFRALLFALGAALLTALLFGMAPSLRAARLDPHEELRTGGRSSGGTAPQRRLRHLLVVSEVALAVVLLVAAGLLVRSFVTLLRVDRGYDSSNVLTASVFIWQWNERDEQRANFVDQAVRQLGEIPGVVAAGATSSLPIPERIGPDQGVFAIVGQPLGEGERPSAHVSVVTPGAFDVLRIPLRSGRLFTTADDATRLPVALVNESLARRYWPRESPIGKRIVLRFGRFSGGGPPPEREIVGVVGDTRQSGLEADPRPAVFIPHAQYPTGSITLVLRTRTDAGAFVSRMRTTMASMNRELPLATVATLDALLDATLKPRRFGLLLLGSFSVAALILAVVGVYGSIAQHAAERKQEIGVRLALGASGGDVLALMLRRGIAPAALGVAGGLAVAATLTHLLRTMLYAVTPLDGFTFAAVPAVMLATAALACWLPAWRATRVDPTLTLRGD